MSPDREDYNSKEYKAWRWAVFSRDGFTCCHTGMKGGELEAHHIVRWADAPHLRYVVSNGITLSKKVHEEINGIEDQFQARFKKIVEENTIKYHKKKGQKDKTTKSKNIIKKIRQKWKPKNPRLRY